MVKMLLEKKSTMDHMGAMWNLQQENSASCAVKSILVVEGDSALRNLLGETLQDEMAYQVVLAPSGKAALNTLQTVTPQLFLLDSCLPDMNGLELVKRIRSMQVFEQTPVLLMSGSHVKVNTTGQYVKYLNKPFCLNELIKLIEESFVV